MLGAAELAPTVVGAAALGTFFAIKFATETWSAAQAIMGIFSCLDYGGFRVTGTKLFGVVLTTRIA